MDSLQESNQNNKICKIVIQQCEKANLCFDTSDNPVNIERGMIIFVCFLRGATEESIDQIVGQILNAKLCETETGSRESAFIFKNHLDFLIIPQATLGGKIKGKNIQYHSIIDKTIGSNLFKKLIDKLKNEMKEKGNIKAGIYGARQILSMETNGPFTHVFEF